ncbi:ferrochelatase, partial [Salmonella enterica subsp. enterica serovar Typhimurium]|nr:ferrochelatase [Salmonella enterica subsp. enterica serovar Typhimurium]MDI4745399.1 ferrochelatase [Salmonella enterica subsp. enterica serovar Kentucky]
QSRFGREPWLTPYTDETLKMLGEKGTGHIQVMCPGFAADCLETLEEIAEQNREIFLEAGGKKYAYIPALNATPEHIDMMLKLTAPYR